MDRFAAMIVLLLLVVCTVLLMLTFFVVAPIICSCLIALMYCLYLFVAYEESGLHQAQEFENRFWTIFAVLLSTALIFANDSPFAFGLSHPALGILTIMASGYFMHLWDRCHHRVALSRQMLSLRRNQSGSQSLIRLRDLGIPVEDQLSKINSCLKEIDQLLIPSTINNFLNQRFVLSKEREIINVFEECDPRALNYLISRVKLGLLFYKIKDHRNFNGKHRTELINLLAVERLSILTVDSRVILLHSLQLLKLRANPQAENWVRTIILNTHQDDLSELKTLTDSKGDYFCMPKLIYDDIRSEAVRQDILRHIRREAAVQQTNIQMGTRRWRSLIHMQWRKVLSDVDDTLYCSGGMYPAGVDKRFSRKTVYPGVLAFYRELDLGIHGPEEWPENSVGNLVFLSARPHVYKDMSEKANYAKFEKLRARGEDGRRGLHTMPSLLAGDLASGSSYIVTNDFEPLAKKKFENFKRFVSIYPEFQHVFVCDNGQGDVRAGELMFDSFPYEFEALYVHIVTDISKTYGYAPDRWRKKEFRPFFFRTYPEAALHAATRYPPLIRLEGLRRICDDAVKDFEQIKQWPSDTAKVDRRIELNQSVWRANQFLEQRGCPSVELIKAQRRWADGDKVRTPYGIATVRGFDPTFDLYHVELDWRPLDAQTEEHTKSVARETVQSRKSSKNLRPTPKTLETVLEDDEADDDNGDNRKESRQQGGESSAEKQEVHCAQTSGDSSLAETSTTADTEALDHHHSISVVKAWIGGRSITKFTPPVIPKIEKRQSLFSFRSTSAETKDPISVGDQCTTPYGLARVLEYRRSQNIVVVEMVGWKAKAYLRRSALRPIQKSILESLLQHLAMPEAEQKPDFPFGAGTKITTAFGPGAVVRPILSPKKAKADLSSKQLNNPYQTVAIALESWKLSDGSSPILYCTPETAQLWKEQKAKDHASIFSALGTFVSTSRSLFEPFLAQKEPPAAPPRFKRYYEDGAAVTTEYGHGVVKSFRSDDGFYEVSLNCWALANKKHPVAYLQKDDIRIRIAAGCQEGYPVLTNLGLSGTLASVEPTTGVHIVTVPSSGMGMVCYMQPDSIVVPLKAAVGEDVSTEFGEGKVEFYDRRNHMYRIRLNGWNALLYAKSDTFERLGEGIQDRDGPFGVKWLLGFLFFSSDSTSSVTRSRSNSVVSGSQSNRSVS
ncbi:hypothetical protein ACA910_005032 [Epithemia clementina (nom. ined.)]